MSRPLRVFFPWFRIESHREPWQSARLVVELARCGVRCVLEPDRACDAAFVASFGEAEDAAAGYSKHPHNRKMPGYRRFPRVKVVHYCWDLYPWVVDDADHPDGPRWRHYLAELRHAHEVWVPTPPVARRVEQYCRRSAVVVPPVYCPWGPDPDCPARDETTVVDVLRDYPSDPNRDLVGRACAAAGLPWTKTRAGLPWDEYRRTVAGARVLASAYREASTGSLALFDGYALGKHVLLSDSEWHGGRDLFGDRAGVTYFRWDDPDDFAAKVRRLAHDPLPDPDSAQVLNRREWVEHTYGEAAFARRVADNLRRVCG